MPNAAMRELADAELLRRIADRRQEALAVLYDRFSPLLLALTRRILGNGAERRGGAGDLPPVWAQPAATTRAAVGPTGWCCCSPASRAIDLLRSRGVRGAPSPRPTADPQRMHPRGAAGRMVRGA